jgi:RNA polymerase sigma-70 factor (ECF subfamily)
MICGFGGAYDLASHIARGLVGYIAFPQYKKIAQFIMLYYLVNEITRECFSKQTTMNVETLYNTYGPMVLRRCRQLLRNEDRALDAMQDVFVRVLQRQNQLHSGYPSSLLYRIATNICLNYIRDQRTNTPGDDILTHIAGFEEPESRIDAKSLLDTLFGCHQISTRTIAVLHFVDGLTLEEVAREVNMSVSGIRKRLRGLRESLVDLLEEP